MMRRLHGKDTKRYIKYDDDDYSLFLELRLPGNPVWLRIFPCLARELKEEADREDLLNARSMLARPTRRAVPVVDLAINFSPVVPRQAPGCRRSEDQGDPLSPTEEHRCINANLRAASMKTTTDPPTSPSTSCATFSTPLEPRPNGVDTASDDGSRSSSRGPEAARQVWQPPPPSQT